MGINNQICHQRKIANFEKRSYLRSKFEMRISKCRQKTAVRKLNIVNQILLILIIHHKIPVLGLILVVVVMVVVVGTAMHAAPLLGNRRWGWSVVNVNSLGFSDGNNNQVGVNSGG